MALSRILEPEVMDDVAEAHEYDAMDHDAPNAAFVERLIALGANGHMLDLGTGPGHIPILVCEQIMDATVVGIDLSDEMLKIAERRVANPDLQDRITLQQADVKNLPFDDDSFDVVFSNTILHHIPDPGPMIAEAARVMKPDGLMVIRDLFRPASLEELERIVQLHASVPDIATPRAQQLFRDSLLAALTPEELRDLVKVLGLSGLEVVSDTDRHMTLQTARH